MSNYRAAFEAALQQDPCDVTTRLIFADWLEENGFDDEAVEHRRRATPEWIASYQWMVAFANRGGDHCENYGAGWEEYRQKTEGLDWQNPTERALIEAAGQEMRGAEMRRDITVDDCIRLVIVLSEQVSTSSKWVTKHFEVTLPTSSGSIGV